MLLVGLLFCTKYIAILGSWISEYMQKAIDLYNELNNTTNNIVDTVEQVPKDLKTFLAFVQV
jgi:hypothetical protein